MSETNVCSLCVTTGDGYKRLYNASGDRNDVYEITVKYFDPVFLKMEQKNQCSAICVQCWQHINDFHNFKQYVNKAQSKLIEFNSRVSEIIVNENEVDAVHVKHDTHSDAVVVLEDEARAAHKLFNLNDKQEFTFSSESAFINRAFSTDYVDIIDVSLDCITPLEGSIDSHHLSNMSHHSDDPLNVYAITENANPIENNPSKTSLKADTCNRHREKSHKKRINHNEFIAEWREKFKCVVCDESCSSLTVLRKHFLQNHPNQECYVMCCERKFNHFDLIEDHIRLHIDPRSFKCEVCRKCFSNSRILCEHLAKRHSDDSIRTYNCPRCKKCFHTKE